jgi:putative ABC transport system permease protein
MSAVIRAARGGMGGRRLQVVIIALVVLAACAASTLAVGMLADAHSPFDHAFATQRGADVDATVSTAVASSSRLAATTRLPGVTAAAGPFAEVSAAAQVTIPGVPGSQTTQLQIVGRSSPGGPVDDLALDAGSWPSTSGGIVLSRDDPGGIGSVVTIGSATLTVTGVADSVTDTAQAWVLPSAIGALGGSSQAQMLYRFASAGTTAAISADIAAVRGALPRGGLVGTPVSWLNVAQAEQSSVAVWTPFIIAFGVIALVISVLIVINVVSGAVIAGTTRIGVLKSIGFTPAQVVASYVLLVAVPAVAGCVVGVLCGNLLAAPLLGQNARVYGVGRLGIPFWVDLAVPLAVLALTVVAAVPPASRAGRLSAVQAIAAGRAPRLGHGYVAQRVLARVRWLPRAATLGLAAPFARPARTMVTVLAVLFGAVAVTFGVGLASSLDRAYDEISQSSAIPVQVVVLPPGLAGLPVKHVRRTHVRGGQGMTTAQQQAVAAALAATPGTSHYLTETDDQLDLPGTSGSTLLTAYGGDPSGSGLALISGRWYSGSAPEIDVNTLFLTDTGTSVGSSYVLTSGAYRVTVRIVGEVFQPGNGTSVYLSPATLAAFDPSAGPSSYDIAVRPGTSVQSYANALSGRLGDAYSVGTGGHGGNVLFAAITLVAMLTILIAVVAGLGVLNSVALQIRERVHDIGVYKSVGMTPRQTLVLIIFSVAVSGLVAGIVAVPVGVLLHHALVPVMAHAANSGYPSSLVSVFVAWELVLLALAGLVIAIAGALGPASWAASARTAFALRAE